MRNLQRLLEKCGISPKVMIIEKEQIKLSPEMIRFYSNTAVDRDVCALVSSRKIFMYIDEEGYACFHEL